MRTDTLYTFFLYTISEESIEIIKSFIFWLLKELHVLLCPEHDLTFYEMSVSLYVTQKCCRHTGTKTTGRNCTLF